MKYTKGPWTADDWNTNTTIIHKDEEIICEFNSSFCEYGDGWEANVRLVKESPELFEALTKALAWIDVLSKHAALPVKTPFDRDRVDIDEMMKRIEAD